jgi:hypothetical protein
LPEKPRLSKRSEKKVDGITCKYQVDPNDFYLPFDNQFAKRTNSDLSFEDKYHFKVSAFDDSPVSADFVKPGGMKPLDPSDDVSAPVITVRSVFVGIILSLISVSLVTLLSPFLSSANPAHPSFIFFRLPLLNFSNLSLYEFRSVGATTASLAQAVISRSH